MVTAFLLTLLLAATLFAWFGYRNAAILFYSIMFIGSVGWFIHHMTDTIGLSL